MTYQPRDHDKLFNALGVNRVRRALVNGELRGISADRAKVWLEGRRDWLAKVGVSVTLAWVFLATITAIILHGG